MTKILGILGAVSAFIIAFQIYAYGGISDWIDFMYYLYKTLL